MPEDGFLHLEDVRDRDATAFEQLESHQMDYQRNTPMSVQKGWRRIGWLIFAFATICALIAFLTPEHVLDENKNIEVFCMSFATTIAPAILKYAKFAALPQVTIVYLTSMLLLMPVVIIGALICMPLADYARNDWTRTESPSTKNYKYFLGPIVLAILVWGIVVAPVDFLAVDGRAHAFRSAMLGSRLGLAFVGGMGAACFLIAPLMLVFLLITPVIIYFDAKHLNK